MRIYEITITEIPTYNDPAEFYTGGKDLYQVFRKTFPGLPEQVANDMWNQTKPGSNPDITGQIKQGVPASQAFLDYFTAKKHGRDAGTGLTTEQLKKVLLKAKWAQRILQANPGDFTEHTKNKMIKRQFGIAPGEDPTRIKRAQSLAKGDGTNEAVTIIDTQQGYALWEGFHRTMSNLKLGDNGKDPTQWNKIKLRAWVGSI